MVELGWIEVVDGWLLSAIDAGWHADIVCSHYVVSDH